MNMKIVSAALAVVLVGTLSAEPSIDFSSAVGPVKPVNAVGQPPILGFTNTKLFHYLNLLKALEANGVEPYYRLGVTIENAAGEGFPAVLVANISAESLPLPAVLRDGGFKVRAIDATHDFYEIPCSETIGKDTVLLFER